MLQKWFSRIGHKTSNDPYYLSIASNCGSLIALLSYPFILEPSFGLSQQQQIWSSGFLILCALISLCMFQLKPRHFQLNSVKTSSAHLTQKPKLKIQLQWLAYAFIPSSLLLATTNYISNDIATVPLLWVVPLALYLLSFILVFSRYSIAIHKKIFFIQPWIITPFLIYYFSDQKLNSFSLELVLHLLVFFISIMVCHGELAKKRPATSYLTQYYLIMSFGGMLGGVFNSFIAPTIFNSLYEYPLMIVFALLLNPIHKRAKLYLHGHLAKIIFYSYLLTFLLVLYFNFYQFGNAVFMSVLIIAIMFIGYFLFKSKPIYLPLFGLLVVSCSTPEKQHSDSNQILHQSRNFYGVLSIIKNSGTLIDNKRETLHEIYSGTTRHGSQLISNSNLQCVPNGYYSRHGPLGDVFATYNHLNNNWLIGVVGLGAGEMAAYAKDTQHWDFFELNPAVVEIATKPEYFTFLNDCIKDYDIQIGDARITLSKQQTQYDLLVIDAFTSDSIPTHLLTREAMELYFSRLNNGGLLVFHISNRYLKLKTVLATHAKNLGLTSLVSEFRPNQPPPLVYNSDWAIVARNKVDLKPLLTGNLTNHWQTPLHYPDVLTWTDDFTSLLSVWK